MHSKGLSDFFSLANQQHNLIFVPFVPYSDRRNLIDGLGGLRKPLFHSEGEMGRRNRERGNELGVP